MKIRDLKIEYRKNPIGLDEVNPRFSWKIESNEKDVVQDAYEIKVYKNSELVWNTNKVESDKSILIKYEGKNIEPSTIYMVNITVWDNKGNKSEIKGNFESGLLNGNNFKGKWITHTLGEVEACPVFEKKFKADKKVLRARIYATALGLYEIELNGEKVGEAFFTPGWTNYKKRLQYQTYDVTEKINKENEIKITVADGWYKGRFGFMYQSNHYGDRVAALAEIHVWYEDGSKEIIHTDKTWDCTTGKIRYSEIYNGEIIDSTILEERKLPVEIISYDNNKLVSQECEYVRVTKKLKPKKLIKTPKDEIVLDFGQNIAGIVELKINGQEGQKIVVKHAEVLDKDGNFYTENLRSAKAMDTFICKGGEETFMPHFTFHGFRYICVEGMGEDLNLDDFTACALHTDMEETGEFSCSSELVNQLQSNIQWGQRGNFLDVPTDCPQRDERLGWTGDAQVFCKTAGFNMNTALFFSKWLKDLASEQTIKFGVPDIVPNILGDEKDGTAAWGDAATIIPWNMYKIFGDKKILETQYDSMRDWVEYIDSKAGESHLWNKGFQYGDWLGLDKEEVKVTDRTGATDVYLVSTAFFAHSTKIVADTAKLLGKEEEFKKYISLYEKIKEAFNEEFITKTGRLVSETQTACILALYFDLAKPEYKNRIRDTFINNLSAHKNHLATGFVGTPYICNLLSEMGRHDLAGILLLNEDYPSWLYSVKLGATTMWERWNSMKEDGTFDESGMNSFNHYAYGSIGDWMYEKLAGLQIIEPGYKKSKIYPQFIKGITNAKAAIETVYGRLSCSWICKDGKIIVDIEIPANTTAIINLPEKKDSFEVGSGIYHYEYETDTNLEVEKYSMASTLGFLFENEAAVDLIEKYAPGSTSNPMIKMAYDQTISELMAYVPAEGIGLYEMAIKAANEADRKGKSNV